MFGKYLLVMFRRMLSLAILLPTAPASAAADLLPDLRMAQLRDIKIQDTADGRRLLRFSTVVVNVGEGAFEVRARRPDITAPDMTTEQRIFDDAGNSRYISTAATMFFSGDGHNHWHVRNFQHYELNRLDNGVKVGTGAKSGFCFFDNEIFGALTNRVYTGQNSCNGGSSALQTTMGLSAGWGDLYGADLFGQYIDITGLASGQYRLSVTADLDNWFLETDDFNNSSWVDIQVTGNGLNIQGFGAFATPPTGGAEPVLAQLTISETIVAGCKNVSGTVTLSAAAPLGGKVVVLSDTLVSASAPLTVTIPAGMTSKGFTIKTVPVAVAENGTVSATLSGAALTQTLTVRPMGLLSLAVTPTTVVGSNTVIGTAKLECLAGPGPVTVDLASSNSAVANPIAASIAVPQGLSSATFDVATSPVMAKTSATISGSANTITKSRFLNVTPAASVSPTILKIGSVTRGTTSNAQTVTLANKGVVPFSVSSIGLTGASASWFVMQSNNCPSNLPAGGSCTISVQFKPVSALAKSAKLTIATSATSTPLTVSLSGTGL